MLNEFWKSVAGKLAERWAAVAGPALVFWVGGLLAWMYSEGGTSALGSPSRWMGTQSAVVQVVVLVAALCGVLASGMVVGRLTDPVLRLLEGYWPALAGGLRRRLVRAVGSRAQQRADRLRRLAGTVASGGGTPEERAEFIRLDRLHRRVPATPDRHMPTRIGNTLRASESRPVDKYGLNIVAIWPQLWLVLPDGTRQELISARGTVNSSVGAIIWGVAFMGFAPLAWWAVPVGLVVACAAWWSWLPRHVEAFADLMEAAVDIHRRALYEQLRWPLPQTPAEERALGDRLTVYLVRGSDSDSPRFTPPATAGS
ncbi:hypothetical protein ABT010_10385 [Streptomyces sp. NPDC002668]|uniref:hypothetical protein n=1 Tax=Streptomyces sp. NPDC002668 TaxID=3154422 RepID=UPI00331E16F5